MKRLIPHLMLTTTVEPTWETAKSITSVIKYLVEKQGLKLCRKKMEDSSMEALDRKGKRFGYSFRIDNDVSGEVNVRLLGNELTDILLNGTLNPYDRRFKVFDVVETLPPISGVAVEYVNDYGEVITKEVII